MSLSPKSHASLTSDEPPIGDTRGQSGNCARPGRVTFPNAGARQVRRAGVGTRSPARHSWRVDLAAVEAWVRGCVDPVGAIVTASERPWATVLRVPLAGGTAWFKACAPVQAFEPRLTAELFARWPDRVAQVLGHNEERGWLLLADAGTPVGVFGNPPKTWLAALPRYAELQRGEAALTRDHLAHGVPDLRLETLPARYHELLQRELPLEDTRSSPVCSSWS